MAANRLIRISFTAAVLFVLLGPAAAIAKLHASEVTSTTLSMSLPSSHGYHILIQGTGHDVELIASSGEAEAEYRVPGHVAGRRLRANLGHLGLVSVHFEGNEPRHRPAHGACGHEEKISRAGRFKGTIRFRGEEGFTSVSASSAKGAVLKTFERLCPKAKSARRSADRVAKTSTTVLTTMLGAGRREAGRGTAFFYETHYSPGEAQEVAQAFVNAQVFERRGRLEIERRAIFEMNADSLAVSPLGVTPAIATLTAPSPFTGTAEYSEPAGAPPVWAGDLRVPLPGAASVPLAGPGFKSVLCRGNSAAKKVQRCATEANSLFISSLSPLPS